MLLVCVADNYLQLVSHLLSQQYSHSCFWKKLSVTKLWFYAPVFRKLLREDQLEAVTKAAQQEELERRKRLEQQRKDYPATIPTVPLEFLPGKQWEMSPGARFIGIEEEGSAVLVHDKT